MPAHHSLLFETDYIYNGKSARIHLRPKTDDILEPVCIISSPSGIQRLLQTVLEYEIDPFS